MCVQNFDDSRGFAIRITYRISLRSSSLWEPRHPLLKVVLVRFTQTNIGSRKRKELKSATFSGYGLVLVILVGRTPQTHSHCWSYALRAPRGVAIRAGMPKLPRTFTVKKILDRCGNDPSAGSPTETLLRLHLPLNDKVWTSSRDKLPIKETHHNPEASPDHSIGRCDGRCVQRAGT